MSGYSGYGAGLVLEERLASNYYETMRKEKEEKENKKYNIIFKENKKVNKLENGTHYFLKMKKSDNLTLVFVNNSGVIFDIIKGVQILNNKNIEEMYDVKIYNNNN